MGGGGSLDPGDGGREEMEDVEEDRGEVAHLGGSHVCRPWSIEWYSIGVGGRRLAIEKTARPLDKGLCSPYVGLQEVASDGTRA